MIDKPEIVHTAAQLTATIHLSIPRAEIQQVMGPAMGEVISTLAAQGIVPAGPMFSHHFRMTPDRFDFEVGVPVAMPIVAAGRVKPALLPAVKVARTIYHGPYEELGNAWGEFCSWLSAQGLTPAEDLWECYVTGPEASSDPSNWQTELNRPLLD